MKKIIILFFCLFILLGTAHSQRDVFNEVINKIDSISINQFSSEWLIGNDKVNLAPASHDTMITDTLGVDEYMILHRATIWGAVLPDRYIYSMHVRLNSNLSDGNILTYETGAWGGTDTITSMNYLDLLADGAVMVFVPGDTFHIDITNDDLDADSLGYRYSFEKITIE